LSCLALASVSMWREQASRGYEWPCPTFDVRAESSEPRARFVSRTNTQKSSGMGLTRLYYKAFAETKPVPSQSQPKRRNMENEFPAFVAIDWADQKHVWALETLDARRQTGSLDHTPESVDVWAAELRLCFSGQPVAVALEQSRGPLVFMLTKYEHLVLFPIHPTTLANYRNSFRPTAAKVDPRDVGLLLDILTRHCAPRHRLNP